MRWGNRIPAKIITLFFFVSNVVFIFSCRDNAGIDSKAFLNTNSILIDIQPLRDIPQNQVDFIYSKLCKVYPNIVINKSLPLPELAFNRERNLYRTD